MKIIYSGLESSGKSLMLAKMAEDILYRNAAWLLLTGIPRPIASNMKFSEAYNAKAKELGIPIVYWKDLDELISFAQADVFIDEVGNYFDARHWSEVTLDQRRWLTQGAKTGVDIYGAAQDFAQVDKSFRRLVNELYLIQKVMGSRRPAATKPPVRRIWGLCLVWELNPRNYDEDNKEGFDDNFVPQFLWITKELCSIFDTTQRIEKSAALPLKHVTRVCSDPACTFVRTSHA